jgi:hypothetical protein
MEAALRGNKGERKAIAARPTEKRIRRRAKGPRLATRVIYGIRCFGHLLK